MIKNGQLQQYDKEWTITTKFVILVIELHCPNCQGAKIVKRVKKINRE